MKSKIKTLTKSQISGGFFVIMRNTKRLHVTAHHRRIILIDQLYSMKVENKYFNYSTNFLLICTRIHIPDYNHFIFKNSLDKCTF
ncbi:unnamed protein product [Adineta steineri]|uniref:DNA-dependent protein kinase catalytic subunit CC5 domain-containing protein n=1 Tax=Adineta steineri TaxID=433720 RepID=A0A814DG78_9BILA|nr:unnamed protein product [Adineta steineri]CAF4203405.1 unnamed protein product [Adineta steineri]